MCGFRYPYKSSANWQAENLAATTTKNVRPVLRCCDVTFSTMNFTACLERGIINCPAHFAQYIINGDFRIVEGRYSPFHPDAWHHGILQLLCLDVFDRTGQVLVNSGNR